MLLLLAHTGLRSHPALCCTVPRSSWTRGEPSQVGPWLGLVAWVTVCCWWAAELRHLPVSSCLILLACDLVCVRAGIPTAGDSIWAGIVFVARPVGIAHGQAMQRILGAASPCNADSGGRVALLLLMQEVWWNDAALLAALATRALASQHAVRGVEFLMVPCTVEDAKLGRCNLCPSYQWPQRRRHRSRRVGPCKLHRAEPPPLPAW